MEDKDIGKYIIDFADIPYERKLEERALFPFGTLNFLTGGMELGEITVIAGETGAGKTTFVSQCVSDIIKYEKCLCIYGESTLKKQAHAQYRQMTPNEQGNFEFVNYYRNGEKTNVGKFFVTEECEAIVKKKTEKKLFYYDPKGGMDIDSILKVIKVAHEKGGIKYFVIDNLMQLDTQSDDEVREMKDNFEQFRRFVIDNNVHIVVLAHYRKSNDYGQYRRRLEEIAGTSAIGNKCATALNIMRLDNVDKESKYSQSFGELLLNNGYDLKRCDAVIEVLKTRHNKLGFVGLEYKKRTNTYEELRRLNNNLEEKDKADVVLKPLSKQEEIDLGGIF